LTIYFAGVPEKGETGTGFEAVSEAVTVEPEENMDELLENAFLRACKLAPKKAELPILSSNFYRLHIVASCPPGTGII
jgi:translation initiation factor 2D